MHQLIHTIPALPKRPTDGHKGTFGRVGIIGGCASDDPRMIGAPALAALGAARSGCGLVKVGAPQPVLDSVLTLAPFATGIALPTNTDKHLDPSASAERFDEIAASCDALAVGMGMGRSPGVDAIVLRAVLQEDAPCILDADALNALCEIPAYWKDLRAPLVLTPHPGEAKRLLRSLAINTGDPAGSDQQRTDSCAALALRLGCIVVLKGAGTVVSDGLRAWVCQAGHPCMATGGTGDVLAGVIAGLIAQHTPSLDLFACAQLAVQAHASAGETWAREHHATGGMTANDLAGLIPAEVERFRNNQT
jgi:ADP-dependent NAD(P)H-hydrate dehydratase